VLVIFAYHDYALDTETASRLDRKDRGGEGIEGPRRDGGDGGDGGEGREGREEIRKTRTLIPYSPLPPHHIPRNFSVCSSSHITPHHLSF
jgi:hypothetical protein